MDAGQIMTLSAILVTFVAVLFGIFGLMWQMNTQGNRLGDEIRAVNDRLNAMEKDRARLDGIHEALTEILRQQSHTHHAAY